MCDMQQNKWSTAANNRIFELTYSVMRSKEGQEKHPTIAIRNKNLKSAVNNHVQQKDRDGNENEDRRVCHCTKLKPNNFGFGGSRLILIAKTAFSFRS